VRKSISLKKVLITLISFNHNRILGSQLQKRS